VLLAACAAAGSLRADSTAIKSEPKTVKLFVRVVPITVLGRTVKVATIDHPMEPKGSALNNRKGSIGRQELQEFRMVHVWAFGLASALPFKLDSNRKISFHLSQPAFTPELLQLLNSVSSLPPSVGSLKSAAPALEREAPAH
jgi:hypothetical protein